MNEELRIIIRAVSDEAQRNLAGVREELENINEKGKAAGRTIGETMKSIGKNVAVALGAVAALTTAIVSLGKSSVEFQKQQAKLIAGFQASGSSAQQASKTYMELFRFLGDSDAATEAAQSLARITTNTEDLADWTKILQGVYARAGNAIPVESLAEAANETIKVGKVTGSVADALNWLGVSEDAFNERLAATSSLEEREILLRETLNGLYGNAAHIYERNNQALIRYQESQAKVDIALAEATKYVVPLMTELNELAAALLTALKPAFETVSVVIVVFVQWLVAAIQYIGTFFGLFGEEGIKATEAVANNVKQIQQNTNSLINYGGGYVDTLNDANEEAKELRKQLMGFDELNVVNSQTQAAAGGGGAVGGGGTGGGGSIEIPSIGDLDLDAGLGDFQKKVDEMKESMEGLLIPAVGLGSAFLMLKLATPIAAIKDFVVGLIDARKNMKNLPEFIKAIGDAEKLLGKEGSEGLKNLNTELDASKTKMAGVKASLAKFGGIALASTGIALLVDSIRQFTQSGYSMKAVIEATIGVIITIIGVILLFNAALLANPITWIVLAVIALVGAFVILWNECDAFRNFWINLWEQIKVIFAAVVESLKPLFNAIVLAFQEAWELIKVVWAAISDAAVEAWALIQVVWDKVKPYFEMIWNNIKAAAEFLWRELVARFKLAWEGIKAVWNVVVAYFTAVWNSIAAIFKVVRNVLQGNWKEAWEGIKDIVNAWADYFKTVWANIKKVFAAVGDYFKSVFDAAGKAIKKVFDGITKYFGEVWQKIKDIFGKVGTAIADGISGAVKAAINAVLGTAVKVINGFISAINLAIGVLNAIPGVEITKLSKLEVPKLAKGGIVESATLAMFGENGREAVLPLENNTQWMDALAERIASRNNTPSKIVLALDGKELGYATINSINNITRQSGSLQLVLA